MHLAMQRVAGVDHRLTDTQSGESCCGAMAQWDSECLGGYLKRLGILKVERVYSGN
jgi:hypothetical protein